MIKTLLTTLLFAISLIPYLKAVSFSDNKEWGTVQTDSYSTVVYKNGTMKISIEDSLQFKTFLAKRWSHHQFFPQVKLLQAHKRYNREKNAMSFSFNFFWNEGEVREELSFTPSAIQVSYRYIPSQHKNVSRFACVFKVFTPGKSNELELIGMARHKEKDGALSVLGDWNQLKEGMKMISLKPSGSLNATIIAEDKAWISFWHWPYFGLINNGNYPKWDTTHYKAGEEFNLKYVIHISPESGKINLKPSINFIPSTHL